MTELFDIVQAKEQLSEKSAVFIYSDGGPDHRLTYLPVQLITFLGTRLFVCCPNSSLSFMAKPGRESHVNCKPGVTML